MINLCHLILGRKGEGKSSFALACADEWRARAVVLVHDPAGQREGRGFPTTLPPAFTKLRFPVRKHRTLSEARTAMSDASAERAIDCVTDPDLSPLAIFSAAEEIGAEAPCVLVTDESGMVGTLADDESERKLKRRIDRLCTLGRHLDVGLIMVAQDANLISYRAVGEATRITLFFTTNDIAQDKLKRAASLPRETLRRAQQLQHHQYIDIDVSDRRRYPRLTQAELEGIDKVEK